MRGNYQIKIRKEGLNYLIRERKTHRDEKKRRKKKKTGKHME